MFKQLIKTIIILLIVNPVHAQTDELSINVVGLMRDHAVIEVNGSQHTLKVGERTAEGVELIAADSNAAVLEIDGQQQTFPLGTKIGGPYTPPAALPAVSLWPTDGMYLTNGSINGFGVDFLIDTGASAIALNAATANRLGINYLTAPKIGVKTASGTDEAYQVNLKVVQLGEIRLFNVTALVIDGPEPERALLGMSFLNQLDLRRRGDRLDLMQKL